MTRAREKSYYPARLRKLPNPIPFTLNLSRFAKSIGMSRESVSRGWHRLIATGLIIPDGDRFKIQKDYRKWKGVHLLSDSQLAFADRANGDDMECDDLITGRDKIITVDAPCTVTTSPGLCDDIITPPRPPYIGNLKTQIDDDDERRGGCDEVVTVDAETLALAGDLFGREASGAVESEWVPILSAAGGDPARVRSALRRASSVRGGITNLVGFLLRVAPTSRPDVSGPVSVKAKPARGGLVERIQGLNKRGG